MTTSEELFDNAFFKGRPARSTAYRAGVLIHLRYRMLETKNCVCPYNPGTAECDAFWAGVSESWNILQQNKADRRGASAGSRNA